MGWRLSLGCLVVTGSERPECFFQRRAGGTGFLVLAAFPLPAPTSPIGRPPAVHSVPEQLCPDPSEGLA